MLKAPHSYMKSLKIGTRDAFPTGRWTGLLCWVERSTAQKAVDFGMKKKQRIKSVVLKHANVTYTTLIARVVPPVCVLSAVTRMVMIVNATINMMLL